MAEQERRELGAWLRVEGGDWSLPVTIFTVSGCIDQEYAAHVVKYEADLPWLVTTKADGWRNGRRFATADEAMLWAEERLRLAGYTKEA